MPLSVPASGWQAELELGFVPGLGAAQERTVLARRRHQGPLRVLRPFYPEREVCHVYVVHPPGGVVGGDSLDIRIHGETGSHALITTPAAGKFYRSESLQAQQTVSITLRNASLEWLPQETIYYPGALARQRTVVRLDAGSRFIGWDIASLGLQARAQPFDHGEIRQGFGVWRDEQPLWLDHLHIAGHEAMMQARWGLGGHSVIGTFVACPAKPDDLEHLRDTAAGRGSDIGLSLVDGVLVARAFGDHADAVMRRFIGLWQALRPRLLQRPAVLPRIWAT